MGTTADLLDAATDIQHDWSRTGLGGGFLARHLGTGEEVGVEVNRPLPLASVVKVPLALVVLDRIDRGLLDAAAPVRLDPEVRTPGPTGLSLFEHPCTVAVGDLITTALAISDNAATDALFALVPVTEVADQLAAWGCAEIRVLHEVRALYEAMARLPESSRTHLHELAVLAATRGGGHAIPQLDISHANSGSASALVDLLEAVWAERISTPTATAALRRRMGNQLTRHRFGAELVSDVTRLAAKTGTFLNLRHEVGVVTTEDGAQVAVAALTASSIPVGEQPEADAAIGAAARCAVEALTR